jgi:tetratricopeptide (TPR) repeat protein
MPETSLVPPLRIFLSYSHHDEELCERFLVHLSQLKRDGLIAPWSDRLIAAGTDWAGAIDENLNSAHVIILLVSPDFLASDYCNDVEMDRAMERDQRREALVVPLILKPCDWKTSRFARLEALPKGGMPVVDWPSQDHGFEDAVQGLRRLIQDLCSPTRNRVRVISLAIRDHPRRWIGGSLLAVAVIAGWWLWSNSQRYLKQGTDLLNVGRYADARLVLVQAKRLNPLSRAVRCGLEAVELDAVRSDQVKFEQHLGEANREYPRCAYLKVLSGDQKYKANDRKGAFAEYQEAVKREPGLAEAYFDMGRILDLELDPDSALVQYQKAAQLSPGTPAYHNNLADLYFRREEYDKAIEEYGQVADFPFSALQAAKIYRLQNKLEDAYEREEDAIRWLKDPSIQGADQPQAWAFDVSPTQQLRLGRLDEKHCFAELELAVTRFLRGDETQAANTVSATLGESGTCHSRHKELTDILRWELRRLGNEVPQLTQRCEQFATNYLGTTLN